MKNERNAYDRIEMPSGIVVLGDAVQALNAVYGQVTYTKPQTPQCLSFSRARRGQQARQSIGAVDGIRS
jgi:hypothetical protein